MKESLDLFKTLTGIDLEAFFTAYGIYVANHHQNIINYYAGSDIVEASFLALNNLIALAEEIEPEWQNHHNRFDNYNYWVLMDSFYDIFGALMTDEKMGKWSRSSRASRFDNNIKVTRILEQGQTLEAVANELGFNDINNTWADIAIDNLITEEGYTPDGGLKFEVSLRNNISFLLPNLVDVMQGNSILGKDVSKEIKFENNDLKIVEGRDAVYQTLDTILNTQKGSIPEYPEDGIDNSLIGDNVNSFQYPILFRNLLNLFNKDGRFSNVKLLDLNRKDDSIFLKLEVNTILNNRIVSNIKL